MSANLIVSNQFCKIELGLKFTFLLNSFHKIKP